MRVITLDFETFWSSRDYTLSKMGPIEYVRDPRFHAQLLGVRVDRGRVNVYEPHEIPEVLKVLGLEAPGTVVVGHNLHGFDALVLSERFGVRPEYMVDTLALARAAGISRFQSCSHKALCEYLGTGIKTDGTAVSDGKRWPDDFTPEERETFKRYCADDVLQCSENFFILSRYLTQEELRFESLTARMTTEPGIYVDRPLLQRHLVEIDEETEDARRQLMSVFHFGTTEEFLANIRSKPKFCTMLRSLGVEPPMKSRRRRPRRSANNSKPPCLRHPTCGRRTSTPGCWPTPRHIRYGSPPLPRRTSSSHRCRTTLTSVWRSLSPPDWRTTHLFVEAV